MLITTLAIVSTAIAIARAIAIDFIICWSSSRSRPEEVAKVVAEKVSPEVVDRSRRKEALSL